MALTPKQQRFIEEYLVDLNATQAAIRAGYAPGSAEVTGHRLLRNTKIAAAIAEGQAQLAEKTEITVERVLRELALIGFADMGTYLDLAAGGTLDLADLPEGATKIISEITQEVVRTIAADEDTPAATVIKTKFKLYDKRAALVDIGKHLGLFNEKTAELHVHNHPAEPAEKNDTVLARFAQLQNGATTH